MTPGTHITPVTYSAKHLRCFCQFCSRDDDAKNAAALFLTKHEEWSHEAEHGLICRLANV